MEFSISVSLKQEQEMDGIVIFEECVGYKVFFQYIFIGYSSFQGWGVHFPYLNSRSIVLVAAIMNGPLSNCSFSYVRV